MNFPALRRVTFLASITPQRRFVASVASGRSFKDSCVPRYVHLCNKTFGAPREKDSRVPKFSAAKTQVSSDFRLNDTLREH